MRIDTTSNLRISFGSKEVQFNIQRKIGYNFIVTSIILFLFNIPELIQILNSKASWFTILINLQGHLFFVILLLIFIPTVIIDHVFLKFIQVFVIFFIAFYIIYINPAGTFVEINFIVFGILLSIQYDFFRKYFFPKLVGLLCFFGISIFIKNTFSPYHINISGTTNSFMIGIQFVLFVASIFFNYYALFSEEIKNYLQIIESNKIFVDIGKNMSMLIHNINNKVNNIGGFNFIMEQIATDNHILKYVTNQQNIVLEINNLLNDFLLKIRCAQTKTRDSVDLVKLIKGTIELFKTNKEFIREVFFELKYDSAKEHIIRVIPSQMSQILDNIFKNAIESFPQNSNRPKTISIQLYTHADKIEVEILDSGEGIIDCAKCRKKKCLECTRFKIGKTSKKSGTGLGMIYIIESLQSMEGTLKIKSILQQGTTVSFSIPKKVVHKVPVLH